MLLCNAFRPLDVPLNLNQTLFIYLFIFFFYFFFISLSASNPKKAVLVIPQILWIISPKSHYFGPKWLIRPYCWRLFIVHFAKLGIQNECLHTSLQQWNCTWKLLYTHMAKLEFLRWHGTDTLTYIFLSYWVICILSVGDFPAPWS